MSCTRTQIVDQARKWLGLNEADGSFKTIIDTYNSHKPLARGYKLKYTDEWCSGFASACAIACGATDIIPTEVGCGKHITLFKNMGCWIEEDNHVPSPGDYIFYDWKDDGKGENTDGASHVGIVELVANNMISVIEGNYNQKVQRRRIEVNGRYIRGYGVPKYDVEKTVESVEKPSADLKNGDVVTFTGSRHYISAYTGTGSKCKPGKARITSIRKEAPHPYHLVKVAGAGSTVYGWVNAEDIAELIEPKEPVEMIQMALPTLKEGSTGETVWALQVMLMSNGNLSRTGSGADGKFGAETETALKNYQKQQGIPVSGICDALTWKELLGV